VLPNYRARADSVTVFCTTELRSRWPQPLARQWHQHYPQLFDGNDLRLALNQPRNHFAEWFVAIYILHRDGAYSLVEKYAYANHLRKQRIVERLLTDRQRSLLRDFRQSYGVQPPDLLAFFPSLRRFWFAEVKGPGDRLSVKQRQSHGAIAAEFGVPVEVFHVQIPGGKTA
jgi:VRR-NUC domain